MSGFVPPKKTPKKSSKVIFTPRKWQEAAIKWLLQKAEAALFLDPGLGKTMSVLSAFLILQKKGYVKKMLVISKRRIIHNVWPKEIKKWDLPFTHELVHGPKRGEALAREADIYLMNYENLVWLLEQPKKLREQFDMLVCDESTMVKNRNAYRSKALKDMLDGFKRRVILSGTPTPNSMEDLFFQIYICDQGAALSPFITRFRNKYFEVTKEITVEHTDKRTGKKRKSKVFSHELRPGAEEEIYEAIQDIALRWSAEDLGLKDPVIVERIVELNPKTRKLYRNVEEDFIAWLPDDSLLTVANAGVASQKLRQISNGFAYTGRGKSRKATTLHSEKVDELAQLVHELRGYPLLVAYEFEEDRLAIEKRFAKERSLPDTPSIGGHTSDAEATFLEDAWNAGDLPVLLAHPDSVAHGLNLQDTPAHVCFFAVGWNFENHDQFIKRVLRQGQRALVVVYYILAEDTVDEMVVDSLKIKDNRQQRLLRALEQRRDEAMKRGGTMGWKRFEETIVLTDEERRATVGLIIAAIKANSDNPDDPVKSERNVPRYDTRDKNKVRADYNFVFKFIQNIAGWLPRQHVEFHKAVFGEEAISSDQLADLYDVTKTIIMQTVGADEVDDPRCYILKNRRTTLKLWPINLTTNNTEDSDMSKFGNKATDETKPEGPAKKKAPTRKKTSKKKVAKKTTTRKATGTSKKTAAKKAPAKRSSGPSKSDALLKLLKRAKGCSVTEAAEKLGTTDSNIRSMIGALRRSGNDITSQGNGVFKL